MPAVPAPALSCSPVPRAEAVPAVRACGAPTLPRTSGDVQSQLRACERTLASAPPAFYNLQYVKTLVGLKLV